MEWENLSLDYKDSNRHQADHFGVKMRAIGYEIVKANELNRHEFVKEFSPQEIEILARMEHARWNAERFLSGWRYGKEKDNNRRISPYLIPYDNLPDDIKEYDRVAVKNIPELLIKIGLKVLKINTKRHLLDTLM